MLRSRFIIVLVLVLLVSLAVSLSVNVVQFINQSRSIVVAAPVSMVGKQIEPDRFQAIFLTNGQVYFGKLSLIDDGDYKLTDIYYLSVQQEVQPSGSSGGSGSTTLVKLGNELHKPEDSMIIPARQVLFFENMQDAGQFNGQLR